MSASRPGLAAPRDSMNVDSLSLLEESVWWGAGEEETREVHVYINAHCV